MVNIQSAAWRLSLMSVSEFRKFKKALNTLVRARMDREQAMLLLMEAKQSHEVNNSRKVTEAAFR